MWTAHQHSTHTNTHAKTVRRACMHIHKQAHAHTLNVDRADKLTHKHKHTHTHTHTNKPTHTRTHMKLIKMYTRGPAIGHHICLTLHYPDKGESCLDPLPQTSPRQQCLTFKPCSISGKLNSSLCSVR